MRRGRGEERERERERERGGGEREGGRKKRGEGKIIEKCKGEKAEWLAVSASNR